MKLAWCAPARLSAAEATLVHALRALGHEVIHVRLGDAPAGEEPGPSALSWRERERLGSVDARIYTAVDDFDEIAPLYDLVLREPGVILFRDADLDRYFEALWIASGRPRRRPDRATLIARATGVAVLSADAEHALAHLCPAAICCIPPPGSLPDSQRDAAHLIDFVRDTARAAPLLHAADHVAMLLREFGVRRGISIVDRIASAAQDLFG